MMNIDLTITRGSTFAQAIPCRTGERAYRTIKRIENSAPCRLEVPAHGLTDFWPVRFERVRGIPQLNRYAGGVRVTDENNIVLPDFNAVGLREYGGVGVLVYDVPLDLAGYTARMHVRDPVTGDLLLELTTENGRIRLGEPTGFALLEVSATETEEIAWIAGRYDIELVSGSYVTKLAGGTVTILDEETR